MSNEIVAVPVDEAMKRIEVIPDYDPGGEGGPRPCVHTFAQSAFGLLGAHWDLDEARVFMEKHGVEEAGEVATGMGHGLVVVGDGRTIFFATKLVDARQERAVRYWEVEREEP